jgi:hypothetical protein
MPQGDSQKDCNEEYQAASRSNIKSIVSCGVK